MSPEIEQTGIPGCFVIHSPILWDERGYNTIQHAPSFPHQCAPCLYTYKFTSFSKPNVFRGMHVQSGSYSGNKLVSVSGDILDFVLDLRVGSPTYQQHRQILLTGKKMIYISMGIAHGFHSLDGAYVHYQMDKKHSPEHDIGIRYDSFGVEIGKNPILSNRDKNLPLLKDFNSPFTFNPEYL